MDVNILVEVARVADFTSDGDEVREWFGDRARGIEGGDASKKQREECSTNRHGSRKDAGARSGFSGFVGVLADFDGALIEQHRGLGEPGTRILLQIEDLEVGDCGIAGINLMAFGK